ncbi:MAG: RdgB/HAM1 family non-canonical purine NTP pyrophosphatase [Polynucleobacter sp.]|nr:RdgB/HAM1 family non-canonical purine NTP pyrophosphatase [Polynucleobacter sp.]
MDKLVLASNSAGKVREFSALFADLGIAIVPQGELGIAAAPEPYCTFVENALAKARHASEQSGLPALADDSGICVDALGGEPGVRSARYAEPEASDANNNAKLIARLHGKTDRRAHYVCALVLVQHALDPEPLIVQTRWHGELLDTPRGQHGFGYDPYFWIPALGMTAAELDPTQKNTISHRGQALRELMALLRK